MHKECVNFLKIIIRTAYVLTETAEADMINKISEKGVEG